MSLDPIALQVVTGALRAACEEMGATLIRSAHSANIKERRDCSTALFNPAGEMVMQAEHIPVHLGAMPAAVAAVLHEDHAEGRSWILNDPYAAAPTCLTHGAHPVCTTTRAARLPRAAPSPASAAVYRARCPPTRDLDARFS